MVTSEGFSRLDVLRAHFVRVNLQRSGCVVKHPRGGAGGPSERVAAGDLGADGSDAASDADAEDAAWTRHAGLLGSAMQAALDGGSDALRATPATCDESTATRWQQQLWLAGGDDDEYYFVRDYVYPPALAALPMSESASRALALTDTPETHMCIPRFLRRFHGRGAVAVERLFYGGRYLHAHRAGTLVTEAYTHRWSLNSDLGKVLAQVRGAGGRADLQTKSLGAHAFPCGCRRWTASRASTSAATP